MSNMSNPQELKKALIQALAEKGEYSTILKHLDTDEKKEKSERMYKLIEPISAFADMLTENSKGAFMDELGTRLDTTTKENLEKLSSDIDTLRTELKEATESLLTSTKSELVSENLARFQDAEKNLSDKLMQTALEVTARKAEEMFAGLSLEAKLTEEEIEDIVIQSALSVESQISTIIGAYIAEHKLSVSQIEGFAEAVRTILPPERQVTWDSIAGKPEISQGGTNKNVVQQMINTALGLLAISDLTDVTKSATEPTNPQIGDLWIDVS